MSTQTLNKWLPSGLYLDKDSCENGAIWWQNQGYEVKTKKVAGGWKHYRRVI